MVVFSNGGFYFWWFLVLEVFSILPEESVTNLGNVTTDRYCKRQLKYTCQLFALFLQHDWPGCILGKYQRRVTIFIQHGTSMAECK